MSHEAPSYIQAAEIRGSAAEFPHTRHVFNDVLARGAPKITHAAYEITDRAKLAFTTGLGEWVIWSLEGIMPIEDDLLFIDSMWAGALNYGYVVPVDPKPDFTNRARAASFMTRQTVLASYRLSKVDDGRAQTCTEMAQIALHVLPKPRHRALNAWIKESLLRLAKWYPLKDGEEEDSTVRQGPPVPRQACDPQFDFKPKMTDQLMKEFVKGLASVRNPYLQRPR